MARADLIATNFTSGEVSKQAIGRVDIAKYANSVDTCENFLIQLLGGVTRRPGTRYIASTKDNGVARLMPFQYSADQDYVMEMGDEYAKLYSNTGSLVTDTQNDTYTKALLHFNGNNGAKEIVDDGATGHIVTQVGTATLSTAQKKFGLCSLLLDGDSDSVTAPDSADFDVFASAAESWTIDCWIRPTSATTEQHFIGHTQDASNLWNIVLASNTIQMIAYTGGGTTIITTTTDANSIPTADTWYHIAIVKKLTEYGIYINGVQKAYLSDNDVVSVNGTFHIGKSGYANAYYYGGYIDEVRIIKSNVFSASPNVGKTDTIVVPTTPHTSDANTKLLLHFESHDVSSLTTPKIPTFVGTAQISTAQKVFGTGSLLLDGDSDYVTLPDSADWDFGTGDWTIDFRVRNHDVTFAATQIWVDVNDGDTSGVVVGLSNVANKIQLGLASSYSDISWTPSADTWYHIAVVRSGNTVTVYVDGTSVGTKDATALNMSGNVGVRIGNRFAVGARYFNGYIDELRISKGIARWTADFSASLPSAEYTLDPTVVTELVMPYEEDDIFEVQQAHKGDLKYMTHADYHPRILSRTSATAFSVSLVPFVRGPFLDENTTATTITPSSATGTTTLTASTDIFDALHVGSYWKIKKDASNSAVVKITTFTNTKVVVGTVQAEPTGVAGNIGGTAAYTTWSEGAFSAYRGYPAICSFHDGRLWYACTDHEPQKIWGSVLYDYDNFDAGSAADDEAVTFEIATEERVAIRWLLSGNKALTLGTTGGTFSAAASAGGVITPTDIQVNRDTNYGSALQPAKRISSFSYYIQRNLNRIRELSYYYDYDVTRASDMTMLAEHILRDGEGVIDWDYQQSPNDRLWCVRSDGQMAVITRNPEQDVMGWARVIAGTDSTSEGKFESVCVIPKQNADDQVWVIVNRTINGTTKRFIEYFTTEDFYDVWDAICLDSSLSLDSPKTITGATTANPVVVTAVAHGFSDGDQVRIDDVEGMTELNGQEFLVANKADDTFELTDLDGVDIDGTAYADYVSGGEARKMVDAVSGLSHLEGETVQVQMDGDVPDTNSFVVTGGAINLPEKAAVIHAGLPYTPYLKTLRPEGGSALGSSQGKVKRIPKITARLYKTLACQLGTTDTQDRLDITELTTGDKDMPMPMGWEKESQIVVTSDKPLPLTLIALMPNLHTSDL
jgi:hypothetical protein